MTAPYKSHCENCIIRKMNCFHSLNGRELKQLSESKTFLKIKKGRELFTEGKKLHGIFCIRYGTCKLSKISGNGRDQIVRLVKKGDILGLRSLVCSEFTHIKATALEDMEVCFIPGDLIENPLKTNPVFTNMILKRVAQDLKFADDFIVNMAQKNVRQRLGTLLMYLENNFGVDTEGFLSLQLTRSDIANIVGTATELLIRILSQLKKDKVISTCGRRIKIENKQVLLSIIKG